MRRARIRVALAFAFVAMTPVLRPATMAQGLTVGLFDRYVDALRLELGIPGMSGVVLQNGVKVWERGLGYADVSASIAATPDTPYPILNLSETIGSALVLQQCVDFGTAELSDRVIRWAPYPDALATLSQALSHTTGTNAYVYDSLRFGMLGEAAKECLTKQKYPRLLATQVLDRFAMTASVPGSDAVNLENSTLFSTSALDTYRRTLARQAVPYRVNSNKSVTRTEYVAPPASASTGVISTVLDLAKFDARMTDLVPQDLLNLAWQPASSRPTGFGWFIQSYGSTGEKLVWHFGVAKDAYSSLILKVPSRRLTFILLANSDGVSSGLSTSQPNVTQSPFAKLFLQFFAP